MSGISSSSSGLPGDHPASVRNTLVNFAAELKETLENASSGEQDSQPNSPPGKACGGAAFVRSSTTQAVAPSQGGSQETFACGGSDDAAQTMMDQVEAGLQILQEKKLPPAILCKKVLDIIKITSTHTPQQRLSLILYLFEDILRSVGGPLCKSASDICSCDLHWVRFFLRIFDPTTVRDANFELARLFWRRAFEHRNFPKIICQIYKFLRDQEDMLESQRRM